MLLLNVLILMCIDAFWLMAINKEYTAAIAKVQGKAPRYRLIFAVPVYLALGYLLTLPKTLSQAFLLGLCVYAVYDFTLLALMEDYPLKLALMDTVWGGVLMSAAYFVQHKLKKAYF